MLQFNCYCFTAALLTPYCRSLAAGCVKALNYNRIESLGPDKPPRAGAPEAAVCGLQVPQY